MARITNSNALRLGFVNEWLTTQLSISSTFFESAVKSYLSYFMERLFNSNENEVRFVLGKIIYIRESAQAVFFINIYVTRKWRNVRRNDLTLTRPLPQRLSFHSKARFSLFPKVAFLLENELFKLYKSPVRVSFLLKPISAADTHFVLNYFKLRLMQRVSVVEIVNSLHRILGNVPGLVGYRIDITGRFARQQRAGKLSIKKGATLLSTLDAPVSYVEDFILLKHGKCGFKIWMNQQVGFTKDTLLYQP